MTSTESLLARIAEDESRARAAAAVEGGDLILAAVPTDLFEGLRYAFPNRVLAECEAKRRIIEKAARWIKSDGGAPHQTTLRLAGEDVLALMALPDADHLDFDTSRRLA